MEPYGAFLQGGGLFWGIFILSLDDIAQADKSYMSRDHEQSVDEIQITGVAMFSTITQIKNLGSICSDILKRYGIQEIDQIKQDMSVVKNKIEYLHKNMENFLQKL